MGQIFTPKFWINLFISTFFTMVMIYLIKTIAGKFNIPVVSTIAEAV